MRGIRGELLIAVVPFGEEVYLLIDVENVLSDGRRWSCRRRTSNNDER